MNKDNIWIVSRDKAFYKVLDYIEKAQHLLEDFDEDNLANTLEAIGYLIQDKREDEGETG